MGLMQLRQRVPLSNATRQRTPMLQSLSHPAVPDAASQSRGRNSIADQYTWYPGAGDRKSGLVAISNKAPMRLKSRNSAAFLNHLPEYSSGVGVSSGMRRASTF